MLKHKYAGRSVSVLEAPCGGEITIRPHNMQIISNHSEMSDKDAQKAVYSHIEDQKTKDSIDDSSNEDIELKKPTFKKYGKSDNKEELTKKCNKFKKSKSKEDYIEMKKCFNNIMNEISKKPDSKMLKSLKKHFTFTKLIKSNKDHFNNIEATILANNLLTILEENLKFK